jgi:tetratricopeptide (TPR) repeat protein
MSERNDNRPMRSIMRLHLGCVCQINRTSGTEKGCSAKATEAEAGQRPVPPEGNAGPAPFLASLVERQRWTGLFGKHTLGLAVFLACALACTASTEAVSTEVLIQEASTAERNFDTQKALTLFLQADKARPGDAFILQKIARQYYDLIIDVPRDDYAEKKRLATLALGYAQRAVALNPKSAENVLSLAVCHGTIAIHSDTRVKIRYSRLVKEEAERALSLDPDYDWAHHVLGRWHHEVASLSVATRFFVRIIYGGLPKASTASAIAHLERAVALAPKISPHHIELGFAYAAAGRTADARAAFEHGLALPSTEKHDEAAKVRAREGLSALP